MGCQKVVIGDATLIVCVRGRKTRVQMCGCGRLARRLCDGILRRDGEIAYRAGRKLLCSAALCEQHKIAAPGGRDLCQRCAIVEGQQPELLASEEVSS